MDWVEIPTTSSRRSAHPVIWPHKLFRSLYSNRREWFDRYISGPPGAALEYWQQIRGLDFMRRHPVLREGIWPRAIPIGMHGDAGAFNKHESLLVLSWNSLLGFGNTRRKRFVFTFLKKSECKKETLDALMRLFAWSVNVMLDGVCPDSGEPLADGWRGCLCQIRGDWQWYCELFRFPAWNSAERMCWICAASATIAALLFKKCSDTAGWRSTRVSHEEYVAGLEEIGADLPSLFKHVVGLRIECVVIDALHALDLGEAGHIIGNILWDSIKTRKWGGRNQDANIDLLEADLRSWEKRVKAPTRLQVTLSVARMRCSSGYPKLKTKGAQTRHLAPYALTVAQRFSLGTTYDKMKIAVAQLLCKLYNIMASSSQFMTPAALAEFRSTGQRMVLLHSKMHADAFERGERMWKFPPKAHLIDHMVSYQASEWGNPSYSWCYGDEDLVGQCIEIASSCHPKTCNITALIKWLVLSFDRDED